MQLPIFCVSVVICLCFHLFSRFERECSQQIGTSIDLALCVTINTKREAFFPKSFELTEREGEKDKKNVDVTRSDCRCLEKGDQAIAAIIVKLVRLVTILYQ